MKKFLVALVFSALSVPAVAQVSLGYFPWAYSQVQLTSNPSNLIFGDLRVETNSFIANLNIEAAVFTNLQRKEEYNLYLGPGVVTYPVYSDDEQFLTGYFLSLGVRWMPFEKLRQLGILFEISPYVNDSIEAARLRSNLGVAYHFGK